MIHDVLQATGEPREVRVERDGLLVTVKRQVRDLDQFQRVLTLGLGDALELAGDVLEIAKQVQEDAARLRAAEEQWKAGN